MTQVQHFVSRIKKRPRWDIKTMWAYDLDLWPWRSPWLSVISVLVLCQSSKWKFGWYYDYSFSIYEPLGQQGSEWSRDLATLTFDLRGYGACGWCGSSSSIRVPSFVGLAIRKIWRTMCVSINGPGDPDLWPFDLETGVQVASKVENRSSKFWHVRPLGSRIIRYVRDGWTNRRTDKSNAYCLLLCGGRGIITNTYVFTLFFPIICNEGLKVYLRTFYRDCVVYAIEWHVEIVTYAEQVRQCMCKTSQNVRIEHTDVEG